jgi:Ni/Fe-hydrogenase 1 B-type cytochrome subunit
LKNTFRYLSLPHSNPKKGWHHAFVNSLYLLFYISLALQACTGLFMAYSDDIPNLKSYRHTVSDIHSFNMWVIIAFIVIHLGGVILSELSKNGKGVVSDMINGGD